MLQLIESICFQDGVFHRIPLHQERMNYSRELLLGQADPLLLEPLLCIPSSMKGLTVKCRITYAATVENIEYEVYNKREIRSLKLIWDDEIEYSCKFKDRDRLNYLFGQREKADDILIVKNNQVTDTSFSNLVFLKEGRWFTPEFPLLKGTRREDYLSKNIIKLVPIRPSDLEQYEEVRLINSMCSLEEAFPIAISSIR